jgi:hypothetical protein
MKKGFLLILLLFPSLYLSFAQTFTNSNLPIVIITTDGGVQIMDDPRVLGNMKIIYRGEGLRNYVTDKDSLSYLNYNGRINIEIRGSSTQVLPKKQYGFSTLNTDNVTVNNVSLMGLPSENDWILNAMGFDPDRIRDYMCYNLSRLIGEYASGTVYCEVIINNSYKGLYLLQEKIKADKGRVNILKIKPTDNYFPDLSGGYITKSDKTTGGDPVAWSMPGYLPGAYTDFIHDLPKPDEVTSQQNGYIMGEFQKLANSAHSDDATFESGYPSVIDIPSFVDYMIISELSSNADSYQFSTYYHKDRNGKLRAGPVWDNDLTFGNDLYMWGFDRSKTDVWQFSNGDNEGPKFWRDLFNSNEFRCCLAKRWTELTSEGSPLNYTELEAFIDTTADYINEAVIRDRNLWSEDGDYLSEINEIKSFIQQRITWMNDQIQSPYNCPDPVIPPLVITRIMYNPQPTVEFPDPDNLEFIEILNAGIDDVNLTGDYFLGTGFVYQFPVNAMLNPGFSVLLVSNEYTFIQKYGFAPFGQFTRHLSDDGEKLILADGLGNIIDYVEYSSNSPWPDANGNGFYIQLTDPYKDNNDPVNWIASNNSIESVNVPVSGQEIVLYPNPATDNVHIRAEVIINSVYLFNIEGKLLKAINPNNFDCDISTSSFPAGIYYIKVISLRNSTVHKLIIQ